MPSADRLPPRGELHVWQARLDRDGWPSADALPVAERERAGRLRGAGARRRWTASRWALRGVLGRYLGREPDAVELRLGERGKPALAGPGAALRFNLSHSGELAVIALADGVEVGVDVQAIGRKPPQFYADWVRREAVAKCHGVGLWAELPDGPVAVAGFDAGDGFAAAVAVAGEALPRLRHFAAEPGAAQ